MSQNSKDVFEHCYNLACQLMVQDRMVDAWAILSALQAYLDVLPAYADGSCRRQAAEKLSEVSKTLRDRTSKRVDR